MTRRIIAVIVILATMAGVQRLGAPIAASTVALPLGFALIAAYLLGAAAEWVRLPRLSGYLIFGLLCGPFVLNLITAGMARDLQIVNGFALALIALIAGLELNAMRVRPHIRGVLVVGGTVLAVTIIVLTAVIFAAWPVLPFEPIDAIGARLAAAFVTAALVASFSPTVTIAVIAESRSRGPLTELVMAIVVMADLFLIFVVALGLQFARWSMGAAATDVGVVIQLSWDIVGSLAFGGIVGAAFAAYLHVVGREITLALLAVCALLAVVAPLWHFELILSALAAGLVVENIAPPEGDELRTAIERGALPVLVAFFAAAGASLQLDVLAAVGVTALVFAVIRFALIRGIADIAVRRASLAGTPARFAWMGLISQAGVTLGLATIVASEFPGWGGPVRTLVVGLTGLHVLVGPILLKAGLQRAGEIGASAEGTGSFVATN